MFTCSPYSTQADTPATLSHVPLAGEAHLLLDGIEDAPHVLIHLQALEQSGFTGKGEKRAWPWFLDPKGRGHSPSRPTVSATHPCCWLPLRALTGQGGMVTA